MRYKPHRRSYNIFLVQKVVVKEVTRLKKILQGQRGKIAALAKQSIHVRLPRVSKIWTCQLPGDRNLIKN